MLYIIYFYIFIQNKNSRSFYLTKNKHYKEIYYKIFIFLLNNGINYQKLCKYYYLWYFLFIQNKKYVL